MDLYTVKESANQIALAIQKIVGVDVVIVDAQLGRIADTFRYSRDRIAIRKSSIVGRIIDSGKPLAIDNKAIFQSCIECPDSASCQMQSMIGVPILYRGETAGAIALVIPARHVKELFENLSHTLGFLEKMAEMLSGKMQAAFDYETLELEKRQREILANAIGDGVAMVDAQGTVLYHNRTFAALFGAQGEEALQGQAMEELIRHPLIRRFLLGRGAVRESPVYFTAGDGGFDGTISITPYSMDDVYRGAVFHLRRMGEAEGANTATGLHTPETLLPGDAPETRRQRGRLQKAAEAGGDLLAVCGDRAQAHALACVVHALSPRAGAALLVVDCLRPEARELEEELFGSPGGKLPDKTRLAHRGTLCLLDADRLPLYLQRRLCESLYNSAVATDSTGTRPDVRLLLTAGGDVADLAARGLFDEVLYRRIRDGLLRLPPLERCDTGRRFGQLLADFAGVYDVPAPVPEPEAMAMVRAHGWPGGVAELRCVAEAAVRGAQGGAVTARQLAGLGVASPQPDERKSVHELVEQQLRALMDDGHSPDEICEIMKISRATLYRKLKQYQIKRKEHE